MDFAWHFVKGLISLMLPRLYPGPVWSAFYSAVVLIEVQGYLQVKNYDL